MTAVAVAFDLDGTLLWLDVEIEPAREAIAALFRARGFVDAFRPILPSIERAAAAVAADDAERLALVRRARGVIDDAELAAAARARARPEAAAVLARLTSVGATMVLVTDNGRACVAPALAAAGLGSLARFARVITRDEARPKPDPAGLTAALADVAPDGARAWWIGDSPRDVAAGLAVRASRPGLELFIVALAGGRGDRDALAAAGPDRVVASLAAVADDVERVTPR